MACIYLSSTYEDLKDHRRTVIDALRKSGYQVIGMEDYVARDDRPVNACLNDIDQVDIYIGLFGFRYGYIPPPEHGNPEGLSITELEYRRAEQTGKTCLVFLADERSGWTQSYNDAWIGEGEGGTQIKRLRQSLSSEKMGSFFTSPYHLASLVLAAVHRSVNACLASDKSPAVPAITWDITQKDSPYPGLAHFTRYFAPVYFGRETEMDEVLERFSQPEGRFLIVSGDSGTGKSSLVDAGVLPRLEADTHTVYLLPSQGDGPFDALLRVLHGPAQQAGLNPFDLSKVLVDKPENLVPSLRQIIARGLAGKSLVVFIDQLEEIFLPQITPGSASILSALQVHAGKMPALPGLVDAFLAQMHRATLEIPVRVIATIRSDWLHHCYAHPDLLKVLRGPGNYPLGRLAPWQMRDMIAKPAACAGLGIAEKLVRRLVDEAGSEPGNLPLLAFVLQALFERRRGNALSEAEYEDMGGLTGAIARHIATVENTLVASVGEETLQAQLTGLFRQLIQLNAESLPSRRRVSVASLSPESLAIVDALVKGRILTAEGSDKPSFPDNTVVLSRHSGMDRRNPDCREATDPCHPWSLGSGAPCRNDGEVLNSTALGAKERGINAIKPRVSGTITLSHERLSDIWPSLKDWINRSRDDLHLLRQVRLEAAHWDEKGRNPASLWHHELLKDMPRMVENLQPELNEAEREFIRPEAERLLEELDNPATTHYRRAEIGDRLVHIGDPRPGVGLRPDGLPDIAWVEIPGGTVVLEDNAGTFTVQTFHIARYPVTWGQYRAFLEAEDGYQNEQWWQGLSTGSKNVGGQYRRISNCPAENVYWYEAVAFCRWLGFKLDMDIRLPNEMEWEQASTSGQKDFAYLWEMDWQESFANSSDSHLGRTTAVGMYPLGKSKQQVFDLVGNVWEWCLNEYAEPGRTGLDTGAGRVLRGGSYCYDARRDCRSASRVDRRPDGGKGTGFRCARVQS